MTSIPKRGRRVRVAADTVGSAKLSLDGAVHLGELDVLRLKNSGSLLVLWTEWISAGYIVRDVRVKRT